MKTYRGCADGRSVMVDVEEGGKKGYIGSYPLSVRLDLRNHSPDGFAWGYGGSGPSQLALAILADYAGDKVAGRFYQMFKERVIVRLKMDEPFTLTEAQVERAMCGVGGLAYDTIVEDELSAEPRSEEPRPEEPGEAGGP